jgi:hypothetical protein
MISARQRVRFRFSHARHAAAFAVAAALGGCMQGDFGRIPPTLVSDNMHAWVASDATQEPLSSLPLTSDERLLRDFAYPLIAPPYQRERLDAVVFDYGVSRPFPRGTYDRSAYAEHLLTTWRRSPASAYAQLIDDVRNDITRLPQFFTIAARVRDMDEKRRRSSAFVSAVSPAERADAYQRMKENAAVVDWVRERLVDRIVSYGVALERLVIVAPNDEAAQAEHVINELRQRADYYGRHLPAPWAREQSLAAAR